MFSCEICEIFKNTYFEEHLQLTASKHRSSFLEVFWRSCCSASFNAVLKFSFSAAVVQSWRVLHANLPKCHSITGIFQGISPQLQNSDIEKYILMAASEDEFVLQIFLHGCFSLLLKGSCNHIFVLEILTRILYFLLWGKVKEERIFLIFFK